MEKASVQEQVAEKIRLLYEISHEMEALFPGRHYTPDGHMIGSIGEALAACCYGLELFPASEETHDAMASDGRLVQIKATQINRVALSSEPKWLLVLKIYPDGTFSEEYNGPGELAWKHCGKLQKNGQRPITLGRLKELQKQVPWELRIKKELNWNVDREYILTQQRLILEPILKGTCFKVQRNPTKGEKNLNLYIDGVSQRVGQIWPKKQKRLVNLCLEKEYIHKAGLHMELPPVSLIRNGRIVEQQEFELIPFEKAVEILVAASRDG